jgi:hypothetical protein
MLSKKKSRPIVVDGEPYRWLVSPDLKHVILVIQCATSNGQVLEVLINTDVHRFWIEFPATDNLNLRTIQPSLVSKVIGSALAFGWKPTAKSQPMKVSLGVEDKLEAR